MHADPPQKYIWTRIYTYTYTYTHVHIHTHTGTHIHIYTYTYTYTYIHTWIHIHIHMHIYVHIHIYIDPFAIFSRVKSCSWGWSQSLLTECTLSQEVLDIYVHSVHTSMWLICQTSSTHIFTRGMSRWDDSSFHCDLFHTISTRLITGTIWHLRNLCALEYSAYFQVTSTNTAQSLRFESLPSLNL